MVPSLHAASPSVSLRAPDAPDEDRDLALAADLARIAGVDDDKHLAAGTRVVILAGGRGRRLEPYTSVLPKPLMPIGNRSILEILVHQVADAGFAHVTLCVGYLSHLIRAVFDNGHDSHLSVTYVKEEEPLGTAAPLRLVPDLDSTFVAMNGDLLTTIDYVEFLEHHRASGNVLTIASHKRRHVSDYGVLRFGDDADPLRVSAYDEKPELTLDVSMGIYALEPEALEFIPADEPSDFPDLVRSLLLAGKRVGAFPYEGLWLDIGRHEDYAKAVELWERGTTPE
jgi:NDP-sugar pyrophosphorylase family protein